MKYLILIVITIVCSLQVRGQATVSVPDASVPLSDTLLLPINITLSGQSDVQGIRVVVSFDSTEFNFLGLVSEGTISDSILTVSNRIDSEIIMSFASIHALSSSGVLSYLALEPKEIGFGQLQTKEVRINENEATFPNAISNIIITDDSGNTPPFIIDIPDTVTFFTGQSIQLELDSLFYDVQDSFADLMIEVSLDPLDINYEYDPITNTLTFSAPDYSGEGTLTVTVTDSDGGSLEFSIVIVVILQVSNEVEKPMEFALQQNYPNPFNPATSINFTLPTSSLVNLQVYNLQGQEVATLINENLSSGAHTVSFDASQLSSGVYIYRIQAGEFMQTKKMMLIK
jgi:hypothetical protein